MLSLMVDTAAKRQCKFFISWTALHSLSSHKANLHTQEYYYLILKTNVP